MGYGWVMKSTEEFSPGRPMQHRLVKLLCSLINSFYVPQMINFLPPPSHMDMRDKFREITNPIYYTSCKCIWRRVE